MFRFRFKCITSRQHATRYSLNQFFKHRRFTQPPKAPPKTADKNKTLGIYLFAGIIGMVGVSYAFVPLYRLFCQVTGFGGTTQKGQKGKRHKIDTSREMTVTFLGQSSAQLPWTFAPLQKSLDVYPGEPVLALYRATNHSDEPLIGIAMYGVTPPQAGKYFEKIECFCFDEQRVGPHETVDMPVFFTLNPDLLKSKSMKDVYNISLNYTFFWHPTKIFIGMRS